MQFEPVEDARAPGIEHAPVTGTPHPDHACGEDRTTYESCPGPNHGDLMIHRAIMPGGKRIPLLKTLLTSACERDCYYCSFRSGRDFRRTTFKPEEMARTFLGLNQAGIAQGLFLSSGVAGGGVRTQDRMIATAEILRHKLGFTGYLHLKIMPGAGRDQVERCMQLADRV
jgi:predicted DNA-binding helix-hairpin-helix protein